MSEIKTYPVPAEFAAQANIDDAQYQAMYQQSISDPEGFWGEQADKYVTWFKKWDKVIDWSFGKDDLHIEWFKGATLNVSYNCLDRHLESRGDQVAIIWEGDNPEEDRKITYRELHEEVSKFANVLKSRGVKKGDRVSLYMPMIPEAAVAMLACTRIGAVHSIVFGGFSPDALRDRILDSDCQVVITADQSMRGGKKVPLKANADKAIAQCPNVHTCLVVQRGGDPVEWNDDRDVWYHEAMSSASSDCPAEEVAADDPLFILYTSGSTGQPKGVVHTTGGYLVLCRDDARDWYLRLSTKAISIGARRMSAGSPGTAISSMARWPMARSTRDVRGRADLSGHRARFWEVCDETQGQPLSTPPPPRSVRADGCRCNECRSRNTICSESAPAGNGG